MKQQLMLILLVSLSFAVMPNFHDTYVYGVNPNAVGAIDYNGEKPYARHEFSYNAEGYIDTTFFYKYNLEDDSSTIKDSTFYYRIYEYTPDENFFKVTLYYPSHVDSTLQAVITTKTVYNDKGFPLVDTSWMIVSSGEPATGIYKFNSENILIKKVSEEGGTFISDPDSIVYEYKAGKHCKSTAYYNNSTAPYTEIATITRDNDKITEASYIMYDENGDAASRRVLTFTLKETAIEQQSSSTYKAFELAIDMGKVLHIKNPAQVQCKLFSPLGREISALSLKADGSIKEWHQLAKGYYLLQIKENTQVTTIPFVR